MSSYFGLCSLEQNVVVGWRWRRMFPQHCAVWEFIVNLLGDRDICQQHELLHHGVCLPDSQEMSLLRDMTKLKEDTSKLKLF